MEEIIEKLEKLQAKYRDERATIYNIGGVIPMFEKGCHRKLSEVIEDLSEVIFEAKNKLKSSPKGEGF